MSEVAATRVAVLGVEGDARAQLRRALSEFGADIAIEGDPRQIDPQSVSSAAPSFILVSLDEAIEDALDAYQDIFDDPRITVIFDEAAVTRELGGWELARWARHLASKLMGDQSAILPAAPANAARLPNQDMQPRPGAPISPEQAMSDARLEDYTRDTVHLARDIPVNEVPGIVVQPARTADVSAVEDDVEAFDAMALELNSAAIEIALRGRAPLEVDRKAPAEPVPELDEFTLDVDLSALAEPAAAEAPPSNAAPVEVDIGIDWATLEAGFGLDDFSPAPAAKAEPKPDAMPTLDIAAPPAAEELDLEADLRALEASLSDAKTETESVEEAGGDDGAELAIEEGLQLEVIELTDDDEGERAVDAGEDGDNSEGLSLELLEFESSSDDEAVNFSSYSNEDEISLDLDPALVEMAAALDAHQADTPNRVAEPDFAQRERADADADADTGIAAELPDLDFDIAPAPAQPVTKAADKTSMFGNLELAPVDDKGPVEAPKSAGPGLDVLDFDALVAGLSLVESDAPAVSTRRGAIAVFAGTGGPDAVRQVLSRLPSALPVPVLVVQRLEAGNHDRLVPQLAKVCPVQVALAEAGRAAPGGAVAVLPTGVGLDVGRHGDLRFALREQSTSELLAQLAGFGEDLVVVIASGADPAISEALSQCLAAGAVVIGQEPSSCFDCAAVDQVKALGGQIGAVGDLTANAIARWGS